jgi:hypothetical protein
MIRTCLPEITDAWIAGADLYQGDKLVRRGRPKLANPRQLLSLALACASHRALESHGPRLANAHGGGVGEVRAQSRAEPLDELASTCKPAPVRAPRAATNCRAGSSGWIRW